MARASSHNQTQFPVQLKATTSTPCKPSCTSFICKSLLVLAILIFLPSFPSQPPEFINQSILFTKYWELVRLFFVGIIVSYGLFSRRNVDFDTKTGSHFNDSLSHASRMFHVSSGFEGGFENHSSGSNEKKKMVRYSWSSDLYLHAGEGESMVVAGNGSSVLDELSEPRLFKSEDELKIQAGLGEKKAYQAWDSDYFHGEPMFVTSNGSSVLGEWGKPISSNLDKPLGLPIRSLKSRIVDSDSPKFFNGSRPAASGSKGYTKSCGKVSQSKFGDLGPLNLEKKFEECVSLPSPIPWRSRSGRMEVRDQVEKLTQIPYSMPLSAEEESQFEPPKSPSSHSTRSFSSRPKKVSHSSSSSSLSTEHPSSEMEELEKKRSCFKSSNVESQAFSSKFGVKDQLNPLKSRPFSFGSQYEMSAQRSLEDELKDFSGGREHILASKDHQGHGTLHVNLKPATPFKPSWRGKSVRTVRACEPRNEMDDKIGQKLNNFNTAESVPMMKNGTLNGKSPNEMMNQEIFNKYQKGEKQKLHENFGKDWGSTGADDHFEVSSDEEESASFNSFNDVGSETHEVDKKAGEFIAKFKDQIRLQKAESMNGSSGHWATYW